MPGRCQTRPGGARAGRDHAAARFELQANAPEVTEAGDPAEELSELAEIDVPALVAAGELDKPDFLDGATRLAEVLPRSRPAVIPGAGHLAPLEAPAAFRELVLGFLQLGR